MSERKIENNKVIISGEIVSNFAFSHSAYGKNFYVTKISTKRKSGTADVIPVVVSDDYVDVELDWEGSFVRVCGNFRSHRYEKKLILYVFARQFEKYECDENCIFLDGLIVSPPTYRATPSGRQISDILLSVNRPCGKSDYIPCVCWEKTAEFASGLETGTRIATIGRIQSREYLKYVNDTEVETKTAYEVSIGKINVIEESEV